MTNNQIVKKRRAVPAIISENQITKQQSIVYAIISFTMIVIVWQLAVLLMPNFGTVFPGPYDVVKLLIKSTYEPIGKMTLFAHLWWTLKRIFIGYFIGAIIGIVTGLSMGTSKFINAVISPIFEIFRPIPAIAWVPMAILWFGLGESSKYFIIGFSTFVICALNSIAGAKATSETLKGAAKMLGATDRQLFTKVIFPSSIPQIFAGLQISLSASCSTILAAEMVRSEEGAGWMILRGMNTGNMTLVLVGLIVISVTGLILATIMRSVEKKAISWSFRGQ